MSFSPCVLHAQPTLLFLIWSTELYLLSSTDHKAPRYVVLFTPPVTPSLLGTNIFLSTLFSNTLGVFFPQCEKPSFTSTHTHTHTNTQNRQNYIRVYFILYIFANQTGIQKTLDRRLAHIPRVLIAVDFVTITVLICFCWIFRDICIKYSHKSVKEMLQHKISTQIMEE